jgi:Cu+-exporting ATPase
MNCKHMLWGRKNRIFPLLAIRTTGVLTLLCCCLVFAAAASAEMEETHDHHMHSMKKADVSVRLETTPSVLKAGSPAGILFIMRDSEGRPLQGLTVMHDRLVHVVIASADFSVFAHIHPEDFGPITEEMRRKAEYPVQFIFPKAGKYIIAADSALKGGHFSEHFTVDVEGMPMMGSFVKDLSREKEFDGLQVTLSTVPGKIVAGKETVLRYLIRKDGMPVKDLEPYLSAPMHVAVISTDLNVFIHTHGEIPGSGGGDHHTGHEMHMHVPPNFGPELDVPVVFPAKGLYQIFSETGHRGKIVLMSFMVEVE